MHIELRYVTRFVYSTAVWESHNALRACPRDGDGQKLLAYDLELDPAAAVFSYQDRWGTRVDTFGIREPHPELVVIAEARVETEARPEPVTAPLDALAGSDYHDMAWGFLHPTRHTGWGEHLAAAGRQAAAGSDDVVGAVRAVERTVYATMDYQPGATEVGVDIDLVWEIGAGVCQDFAHLTIAMLRASGIGARYVSGYFYASDPTQGEAVEEGEMVVATHAWVEAAIPGWGWWAIDPTNAGPVGERHVKIGHGRDYDDVAPLRGVYFGDTEHDLAAEVTMSTGAVTHRAAPTVEGRHEEIVQQQQ